MTYRHGRPPGLTLAVAGLLSLCIGCAQQVAPASDAASPLDDAALWDTLEALGYDLLRSAPGRLAALDHDRTIETKRVDAGGNVLARERVRLEVRDGTATVIDSTRTGRFAGGLLSRFFRRDVDYNADSTLASVIPDDPPYLDPRTRETYTLRLIDSPTLPSVEATRLDGGETDVRRARLTYLPRARQVVRMEIDRELSTFFVRARTETRVVLRRHGEVWLPDTVAFHQLQRSLLQGAYELSRVTVYRSPGRQEASPSADEAAQRGM